eukprot:m.160486 g.160486  ORF g.160486 m.160486 type:complete len:563 (-) comp20941_c0_seq2:129-1817(-)
MEQKLCACTAALRHDPASAPLKSFREEYEGERDLSGAGLQRMTKKGFLTTALAVLADASDALSNTEEEKEKQEPDSPLQIPLQIPDLLACVRILSREMGGAEDLLSAAAFGLVLGVCLHPSSSVGVHHEGIKILTNCILQRPDSIACFLQAQGLHKLAAFVQRHTFSQLPEEVQMHSLQALYLILAQSAPATHIAVWDLKLIPTVTRLLNAAVESGKILIATQCCRVLYLLGGCGWLQAFPDESAAARVAALCWEFRMVASSLRKLLLLPLSQHEQAVSAAAEVLVNMRPAFTPLLLSRVTEANLGEYEQLISKLELQPKPKPQITEKHWDPDQPGVEEVKILSEGASPEAQMQHQNLVRDTRHHPLFSADLQPEEDCVLKALVALLEKLVDSNSIVAPATALTNISLLCCPARRRVKQMVLPARRDLHARPDQGDTLSAKLVRLMMSANSAVSRQISDFLFTLCDRSAARLIRHTGYGCAAGFLTSIGIAGIPPDDNTADSDQDSDLEWSKVDLVTGALAKAGPKATDNMTEEEKEAAAQEAYDLIQKLNATGVIKCKLPD